MIEIKLTGETTGELKKQVTDLYTLWVASAERSTHLDRPFLNIGEILTPEETDALVNSYPHEPQHTHAPGAPKGRGRPAGAKNKPKGTPEGKLVCTLPAADPAPEPTGPVSEACCDHHALFLDEGVVQIKGEGCAKCDEATRKAAEANPVPVPAPKAGAPEDLSGAVRAKIREWILARAVAPDVLTTWMLTYGAADLRGIDPAKYPAMIQNLTAKIGPVAPAASASKPVDPLA